MYLIGTLFQAHSYLSVKPSTEGNNSYVILYRELHFEYLLNDNDRLTDWSVSYIYYQHWN